MNAEMRKNKRVTAGIMSILMLAGVLLSIFFMAAETEHECTGEDCHICEALELCCNTVKRLGEGTVAPITFTVLMTFAAILLFSAETEYVRKTLVSQKVRLND